MEYGTVDGLVLPVSRIVLGSVFRPGCDPAACHAIMDLAFENGINCFDTAHLYANGDADRTIGRWMEKRGNRDKMVILSKGCHHSADRRRVTPHDLDSDLHDILARMKTDYVDMFVLHRDDESVPVGPIVEALHRHWEAGRIRTYGGSNWTWQRLREANEYAAAHDLRPFTVSSQHFSLAEQVMDPWGGGCVSVAGPKEEVARIWHRENRMPLFAYASLSGGFFSGRFSRESFEQEKARGTIDGVCIRAYCYPDNFERLDRTFFLADKKGLTVPQIAIAYVLGYAAHGLLDTFALVGAMTESELMMDLAAVGIALTMEELEWLDLRRNALSD